jgi:nucleoside-diphosphate-sugar epimerase
VRANFLQLLKLVDRGVPLPLGAVKNRRSMVFVGNLADALIHALEHPAAAGRTYLAGDGTVMSTADLVRRIAAALGRPARLVPIPPSLLRLTGRLIGRVDVVERLCGSLEVDSGALHTELGWTPPFTPEEGLRATAEWFAQRAR